MKIIKPSATLWNEENPYRLIERVGRTCYKSEDKMTPDSAEKFVTGLMKRGHDAMLEHSNVVVVVDISALYRILKCAQNSPYASQLRFTMADGNKGYNVISGSFRAWRELFTVCGCDESKLLMGLQKKYALMFEDITVDGFTETEALHTIFDNDEVPKILASYPELILKHMVHTVHFVCDRAVANEFVRHRNCAFAQESSRYCNYSKGKFGAEITVIEPSFFADENHDMWYNSCADAEAYYMKLIENGATPEQARDVLPLSTKTELIITASENEWQHIVNLRFLGTTGAPHPQMKEAISLCVNRLMEASNGRIVVK